MSMNYRISILAIFAVTVIGCQQMSDSSRSQDRGREGASANSGNSSCLTSVNHSCVDHIGGNIQTRLNAEQNCINGQGQWQANRTCPSQNRVGGCRTLPQLDNSYRIDWYYSGHLYNTPTAVEQACQNQVFSGITKNFVR